MKLTREVMPAFESPVPLIIVTSLAIAAGAGSLAFWVTSLMW